MRKEVLFMLIFFTTVAFFMYILKTKGLLAKVEIKEVQGATLVNNTIIVGEYGKNYNIIFKVPSTYKGHWIVCYLYKINQTIDATEYFNGLQKYGSSCIVDISGICKPTTSWNCDVKAGNVTVRCYLQESPAYEVVWNMYKDITIICKR